MEPIPYTFKNPKLFEQALTHRSYANEGHRKDVRSYERLEFLGDSLLSVVISEFLFLNNTEMAEGELSKMRADIVCEQSLAQVARKLNLGQHLKLSRGEENTGGRNRDSLLSDVVESTIAAVYLDSGFEEMKRYVLSIMKDTILAAREGKLVRDNKSSLQELLQKKGLENPEYVMLCESGPDHNKSFTFAVAVKGKQIAEGSGKTKKEAEQEAAKKALALMQQKAEEI